MRLILTYIIAFSINILAQHADSIKKFQMQEIIVFGRAEFEKRLLEFYKINTPATTEEILSRSPSISMIRRGNYGIEPTIRAFSADQINLTIDGMKIQCACTDKMDPITIYVEPQNLNSIDIMTFSNGLEFGSAVGGSINLKLANAYYNETNFSGGFGYQSAANSYNGSFSFNTGGKNVALLLNGTYRKSNNYRAGNGNIVPFSYYKKSNFSLAAQYLLNEENELKANVLFDDGWNIGYPALPMDVGYAKTRIYSLSFNASNLGNLITRLESKIYGNSIAHFMDDSKRPSIPMHMDMPGWSDTYGAFLSAELNTGKSHYTKLRLEVFRTAVRAEMTMYPANSEPMFMLTLPDARRLSASIFATDDWNFEQSLFLTTNVRLELNNLLLTSDFGQKQLSVFEYNTEQGHNFLLKSGSINFTKQIKDYWNASALIGYSERAPSFNEAYGYYLFNSFDGYDYIGNPELRTEKSINAELVLQTNSDPISLKVTAFLNHIKDYIIGAKNINLSTMTIGANGVKIFTNLPYANIYGMEINAFINPIKNLSFISTVKYQIGKDNKLEPLALIPPLKSVISVGYRVNEIGLQGELEYSAAQNNVRTSVGEQKTSPYLLFHFRASYEIPLDNISIFLNAGLENAFDVNYSDHLDWGKIPRPGRNVYFTTKLIY